MCGRFAQVIKHNYLKKYLDEIANPDLTIPINFNVAPTQYVGVIFQFDRQIIQDLMQWRLIPSWAENSSKYNIINTRIESVKEKAFWRGLFRHKRCLIPITGFYEWHKKTKQPFFIQDKSNELIFLAGIYDILNRNDGSLTASFSILTQEANSQISDIHHRMPISIDTRYLKDYLTNPDVEEVLINCDKSRNQVFDIYPVSKAVNRISNNSPDLLKAYIKEDNLTLF